VARPKNEAEVRKALAGTLRHEPNEAIWAQLCDERLVQEVIDDFEPAAFGDLVDQYRRFERYEHRKAELEAGPRQASPGAHLRLGARLAPLERLVALEAAREEGVVSFWAQVLGGRLLPSCDPAELEAGWFLEHVVGSPRLSGTVHAANYAPHRRAGVRPSLAATETALRGYIAGEPQLPEGGRNDYELDFLVCLVECLMAWYGWPVSGEVERFVLCGETPHLLFMVASWLPSECFAGRTGHLALEVSQAASAAELSRFYKEIRTWLAQQRRVPRRLRACGQQATDLALHVARYNDGRRWQEMMAIWNEEHSPAAFADSSAFARRARDAYETLCGEGLTYRGGKRGRDLLRRRPEPTNSRFTPARAAESPTS
jgi:hypothetical protein